MMYSDEKDGFGGNDPTWVGIGYIDERRRASCSSSITIGLAFWWKRSGSPSPAGSSPCSRRSSS